MICSDASCFALDTGSAPRYTRADRFACCTSACHPLIGQQCRLGLGAVAWRIALPILGLLGVLRWIPDLRLAVLALSGMTVVGVCAFVVFWF
ncbi:hypothetical protein Q3Y58_12725 [Pseudovibrio sp. SPO723]|nr:hypothetical protein [Pseudovibrio sp. SPO723]